MRVYWDRDGREKVIQLVSVVTVGTTRTLTAEQLETKSGAATSENDSNAPETSTGNNSNSTTPNQPGSSQGSNSTPPSNTTISAGGSLEAGN